jgi:hypothetical protein
MTEKPQSILSIRIDSRSRYLSDDEGLQGGLPPRCIFDKGKTGCGGTYIALTNAFNYVIAVPFVSLIINKLHWHEGVCGVHGKVMDSEIKEYCENHEVKKFLVTYDSLERLMAFIDPSEYKLLVDEYHILFTHYGSADKPFRKDAVQKVLKNYKQFSDYCFMSATPLEPEFVLEELKELDLITAIWPNIKPVDVLSVQCAKVLDTTSVIIQKYLSGGETGNAYFFINSLRAINKLIKNNGLNAENTRIIYSESNDRELDIPRGDINALPKKINLLTSAAFEGSDIFDDEGRTYIISDQNHPNSLVDISTSFMQICGRIRNSSHPNSNTVVHLHGITRYSSAQAYEDYKTACEKDIEEARQDESLLNQVSEATRNTLELKRNSGYLTKTPEGLFVYDANLVKVDLYHFKLTRILYDSEFKLNEAYSQHGFIVKHIVSDEEFVGASTVREKKMSLKDKILFIKNTGIYGQKGYDTGFHYITDDHKQEELVKSILKDKPKLEEAIKCPEIGFDGFEKYDYRWKRIELKLIKYRKTSKAKGVADMLESMGYGPKVFKTDEEVSEALEYAFKENGVAAKSTSTNIENYFHATHKQKRKTLGGESKQVWGWEIIRKKSNL